MNDLKILPAGGTGYDIVLNGSSLRGVTELHIDMKVNEVPRVQMTFLTGVLDIEMPETNVEVCSDDSD